MDQKIEQHSRLGLQIEFAFLRGGLECRIIPLGPINVAEIRLKSSATNYLQAKMSACIDVHQATRRLVRYRAMSS